MRRCIALCVAVAVGFVGCASYGPSGMVAPKSESMPVWMRDGRVGLGVDLYTQKERQKAVFDGDLSGEGVLPIRLLVRNDGERKLLVRASDMILTLGDGTQVTSAGATTVAARFDQGIGDVIGWGVAFGVIGMLAASANKDRVRTARLTDYRSKELAEVFLAAGESAHGFVYFIPPKGTASFVDATLVVQLVDVEDGSRQVVRVPLSGASLAVAGAPRDQAGGPAAARPLPAATVAATGTSSASGSAARPLAALLGNWRGETVIRWEAMPSLQPTALRIYEEGGLTRWTLTRTPQTADRETTATGLVEMVGQRVTLTGHYDRTGTVLDGTEVTYSLTLTGSTLTGTGVGVDRVIHSLSVTRQSGE